MTWSDVKEIFYTIGAIAGVLALMRPVLESRFTRDQARLAALLKSFDEQSLSSLASRIDGGRQVSEDDFKPFKAVTYDKENNLENVRFSGPVADPIKREIDTIMATYKELRSYIQVDEWEPSLEQREDGSQCIVWRFNKHASAFTAEVGYPHGYAQHLAGAASKAEDLLRAFQRLQIIGELHFLEAFAAKWILARRFRANGLSDA